MAPSSATSKPRTRRKKAQPCSTLPPTFATATAVSTPRPSSAPSRREPQSKLPPPPAEPAEDLELKIEALVAEKDADFVKRRHQLLYGPIVSAPDPEPSCTAVPMPSPRTPPPKILPHDIDAARMGLNVLNQRANTDKLYSPRNFLSPLLQYVVRDQEYKSAVVATPQSSRSCPENEGSIKPPKEQGTNQSDAKTLVSLQRLVQKLRARCDAWRDRFREEARARVAICALHKKLTRQKATSRRTEMRLKQEHARTTRILSEKVRKMQHGAAQTAQEAQEWKLRYQSEALWHVDTSAAAGCQLVNCGYRQLAERNENQISAISRERDCLQDRIDTLIKEKQAAVLVSALRPDEEPPAMPSGFVHPVNMYALAPLPSGGRKKSRGPPKPWNLKRTMREVAALFASKVDSDRRCDYARRPRLAMPDHCKSYYLTTEGTTLGACQMMTRLATAVNFHAVDAKGARNSHSTSFRDGGAEHDTPLVTKSLVKIMAAALGITHSAIFTARTGHTLLGLLSHIAVAVFGESVISVSAKAAFAAAQRAARQAADSKTTMAAAEGVDDPSSAISLGGVLRVVLLKAAMKGEDKVTVPLVEVMRAIKWHFPYRVDRAAPDRLFLDASMRKQLVLDLCELFNVEGRTSFMTACKFDTIRYGAEQKKKRKRKKQMTTKTERRQRPAIPANPGVEDVLAATAAGTGAVNPPGHVAPSEDNAAATPSLPLSPEDLVAANQAEEERTELQRQIKNIPPKTRKLLLAVADNATALRNLFAVFDEDGSGGVSPEELRIALSQFGILLNRKETKTICKIADKDGDGELQYPELLLLVEAVAADENRRQREIDREREAGALAAARKRRRLKKQRRAAERERKAEAAGPSATQFVRYTAYNEKRKGRRRYLYGSGSVKEEGAIGLGDGEAEDELSSSSDSEDDEGRQSVPLNQPTLIEVAEEYVIAEESKHGGFGDPVEAPLGRVIEVCMGVYMRQEARNAENLLAFYRHSDDDKDGNLTWKEFLVLLDAMHEAGGAPKMSPEEAAETYMAAATITPDNVRVTDQKFLLAMMSKGVVAPHVNNG